MIRATKVKRVVTTTDKGFFAELYASARAHGEASAACVELLSGGRIDWTDPGLVLQVKTEFQLGRLAGYLRLSTRTQAEAVFKLARADRSEVQQLAYRAAISAWSELSRLAGAPNVRTGEKRAPRMARNPGFAKILVEPQTKANIIHLVPQVKEIQEVDAFALRLIDIIRAFETRNAKVKFTAYRAVFDKFIEGIMAVHAKQFPRAA